MENQDAFGRKLKVGDKVLVINGTDEYTGLAKNRYGTLTKSTTGLSQNYIVVRYNKGVGSKIGSKVYDTAKVVIVDLHKEYLPELFL